MEDDEGTYGVSEDLLSRRNSAKDEVLQVRETGGDQVADQKMFTFINFNP